jgi:thiamine-monophosphate kinase
MNTSEAKLIRKLRGSTPRPGSRSKITLGIGDDAALFRSSRGHETILTCDWFLEGTHFLRDKHPADSVGWKSLARAVSDVAAMGGQPSCFLLSLALPEALAGRWLDQFLAGLRRAARQLACPLAGGDTTCQKQVFINITVVGEVRANRATLRSGARPGDLIYVSGNLGEAERGLQLLRSKRRVSNNDPALQRHLYPEPRIALAHWLTDHRLATSMMDLSDGLSTDLPRLCAASKIGARLDAAQIPVTKFPKRNHGKDVDALDLALNGGDDYELLFTVSRAKARRLPPNFAGIPLTPIGKITRNRALVLMQPDGSSSRLHSAGWDPFRKAARGR